MTNILGLDISTSRTGCCILNEKGDILSLDVLEFLNKKKYPTFHSKAEGFEKYLKSLTLNIDDIIVESALNRFMPGQSSANVISTLMRFNGILSWICYKHFNKEPTFISATSARKKCGIKIPKGTKAKMVVMETLLKTNKYFSDNVQRTPKGNISPKWYDAADAYIIAKSSLS